MRTRIGLASPRHPGARMQCTLFYLLVLAMLGCASDNNTPTRIEPVFVAGDCPVTVTDASITCGTISVPSNRGDLTKGYITISLARLPATQGAPNANPVIFINGGPGAATLTSLQGFSRSALRNDRELILFDARGTGFSTPSLECPEREEATWENFAIADSPENEIANIRRATAACAQRLRQEGVHLEHYDTLANAADVEDIRQALGIEQLLVYGTSYGTTVALELMRSHAANIVGVVLDAVYPLHEGRSVERPVETATRAFTKLYELCINDTDCTANTGDLELLLQDTIEAYNLSPYATTVTDERSGEQRNVILNGTDLLAGLFNALYDASLIPSLPSIINAVAQRNTLVADEIANRGTNRINDLAEAAFLAVECRDRGSDWRLEQVEQLLQEQPNYSTIYNSFVATPSCEELNLGGINSEFNLPVESNIPTLLFSGSFDPITPPQWAESTANSLSNATLLVFSDAGHGAAGFSACGFGLVLDFLREPMVQLDVNCEGLE